MEIIPAIDLMDGKVVRLLRGDPRYIKNYSDDPLAIASKWVKMGARRLHVVDLDATLNRGSNLSIIKSLVTLTDVSIQVGGGIREPQLASDLLLNGVDRVMLGTLAFKNEEALSFLRLLGRLLPRTLSRFVFHALLSLFHFHSQQRVLVLS